jgi:hypothetical protein
MKLVITAIFVATLSGFSSPAPAGDENCSCTAHHEAMIEMRDYLKTLKAEQLAEEAARLEAETAESSETEAAAEPDDNQSGG